MKLLEKENTENPYPPYLLSFREQRNQGDLLKRHKLTLDEFATLEYLPYIRKSLKSWQTSERLLRCHISPVFGHRKLCEIKRMEVQAWQQNMLKDGLSISTANRILAALKALCSYAELRGYLPFGMSPCYKLSVFPNIKRTAYIAPPDKVREMLNILKQNNHLAAKALSLLILTDARKNEFLLAKWEDIDWDKKRLRSPRNTRGQQRMIELPEEAVEILKEIKATSESNWIFSGRKDGQPISSLTPFWFKFREEMGVTQMRIDDLRYNDPASSSFSCSK